MKWDAIQKIAIYLIPLACLAFFFAASVGVMHIGMKTDDHGHMHDCPFMGMTAICDMSPLQHVSAWQNIYATVVFKDTFTALLNALVLVFAWRVLFGAKPFAIPIVISLRHVSGEEDSPRRDALKEALRRGVVHSKAF